VPYIKVLEPSRIDEAINDDLKSYIKGLE